LPEVRDPLYGDVFLSDIEIELLNTKEFQRLRWLYQLPATHFVFPGATHTRFSHSIGVLELATRMAKNIKKISEEDIESLRIAALLHDVDEPPFYPIFKENYPIKQYAPERKRSIIKSICEEVSNNIDYEKILSILEGKEEYKFLNQIIDSEVGANRIDYLLRDSFYCGVTYGNIDLRILYEFEVKDNELILKEEAIPLVDTIFKSLYQMKVNVYDHRVNRAVLCMLNEVLKVAAKKYKFEDFFDLNDEEFLMKLARVDKKMISRIYQRNLLKNAYCVDAYRLKDLKLIQYLEDFRMKKEEMEKEITHIAKARVYLDFITLRPAPATPIKVETNGSPVDLREIPLLKKWYSEKSYEQWKMYVFCEQKDKDVVKNVCRQIFGFLEVGGEEQPKLKLQSLPHFYDDVNTYLKDHYFIAKVKNKILSLHSNEYKTLRKLIELGSASADEMAKEMGKSRATESIILNNLCNANLVTRERVKKKVIFRPETKVTNALRDLGL
jgi:HD superfamily phosphohydrolase